MSPRTVINVTDLIDLRPIAMFQITIVVLCGLVGASMSTANGAILAISNVCVRNLGGVRRVHVEGQKDPLLKATRIAMVPMTVFSIVFAIYVSLRPQSETDRLGYVSIAHKLSFKNFTDAWSQGDMWRFFLNSVFITVPAVIVTLVLASAVAFVVSRLDFRFNIPLLILFTAGNLLPQQVIINPLYQLYLKIHVPHPLSDSG